jgi:hypothetical protein
LLQSEPIPNPKLMSCDGRVTPRQKQLGPLHPDGTACGEENNAQTSRKAKRLIFHNGSLPEQRSNMQAGQCVRCKKIRDNKHS